MGEAKRALLLNDTALAGNHGSQLVINQLMQLAESHNIKISQRHPLDVKLEALRIDDIDLVIVNGEGSLHHSKKAARAIAAVPAWAEKKRGVHAFLINSIYQDNNAAILEGVRKYKQIYVRDGRSFEELQNLGKRPKGIVDLSLTWQLDRELADDRATVIVTDSTVPKTNAELFAFSQTLPNAYFMPFRSSPPTLSGSNLRSLINLTQFRLRKFVARLQSSPLDRARYAGILPTFEDFIAFICQKANFIVAGRYHAVCIALDLKIPFAAVPSNSFKVEALLEEIGMENRLFSGSLSQLSAKGLMSKYGVYTDKELERIAEFGAEQRRNADLMFSEIERECRGKELT